MNAFNLTAKVLVFLVFLMAFSCESQRAAVVKNQSSSPQIGVALYSFNKFPFSESLDKAKQTGSKVVEGFFFHQLGEEFDNKSLLNLSNEELREFKKKVRDRGLNMPSIYAEGKNEFEWRRFFEIGEILDLEFLVCEPEPEHWDLLNDLTEETGIRIAIHEHAKGYSRYWHPDSVLLAIKGRPGLGACGDLGHWARSGLDPVDCLKKLEGHLISIHAKDLSDFGKADAKDVTIGEGIIDYKSVMKELERQGFSGPIYVECEHNWDDNVGDVEQGINIIQNLIRMSN